MSLQDPIGKRNPTDQALNSCLDTSPEPALKENSRAAPSVEIRNHLYGPDTGRNSGGKGIKKLLKFYHLNKCLDQD